MARSILSAARAGRVKQTSAKKSNPPANAKPSARSQHALDWVNFFIADIATAFGPFVALFLALHGWSQGNIGTAITVNSLVALAVQVPSGWLIDQLHDKRAIVGAGLACLGVGSLVVAFCPSSSPKRCTAGPAPPFAQPSRP